MVVAPIRSAYELEKLFIEYGRGSQFSFDALKVLFDLLEDSGSDVVVDVIALCCEYSEYDDIDDYNEQNGTDYASWKDAEENDVYVVQFDRYVLPERCRHNWQSKGWSWEVEKVGGIVHG